MIKYSLTLLILAGTFVFNFFLADGLVIEDDTPARLAPGESKLVTLTINKGQVTGFAKLQLELPEGLTAEAVDTEGASFTFSAQKAKFIWMTLPQEQEFSISYQLTAKNSASGSKVITGIFSYIKENERVDYDMQSKVVLIGEGEGDEIASNGDLTAIRQVNNIANQQFLVTLQVKNSKIEGFAKILEQLPSGYRIEQDKNNGASVTIDNQSIKFVWFEAPSSPDFTVSYKVIQTTSLADPLKIDGTLAFVSGDVPREIPIGTLGSMPDPIVHTEPEVETEDEPVTEDKEIEQEVADIPEVEPTPKAEKEDLPAKAPQKKEPQKATDKPYTIPEPEEGIAYRVQIAAGPNTVGKDHFKKAHQFQESFNIEQHNGLMKYTTGSWEIYKQARDDRERIRARYNFRGPFVTAYNDGIRITVQEALMITNQRWYK